MLSLEGDEIQRQLLHVSPLDKRLSASDLVINRITNHVCLNFNDKSYLLQDTGDLSRFKRVELSSSNKAVLGSATCAGDKFYSVFKGHLVEFDTQKLFESKESSAAILVKEIDSSFEGIRF